MTSLTAVSYTHLNLTCAFADIPTKRTSRMMLLARKQQGVKAEKLLDVYPVSYTHLDVYKRQQLHRALTPQ